MPECSVKEAVYEANGARREAGAGAAFSQQLAVQLGEMDWAQLLDQMLADVRQNLLVD
jgi:hypothetical protein